MARRVDNTVIMRTLRKFPDALTEDVKKVVAAGAEELRAEIAANAPVDTGELARDVDVVVARNGLSANVGYDNRTAGFKREWKKHGYLAIFHEYGTVKMPAKPFIRPAYRKMLPKILNDIKAAVSASLTKASNGDF